MKKIILLVFALIGALVAYYLAFTSNNEPENTHTNAISEQKLNLKDTERNQLVNTKIPSSAEKPNTISGGELADKQIEQLDQQTQAKTEVSIGSFLVSSEQSNILNTTELNNYAVDELRQSIVNLDYDGSKNNLALETEYKLERKLSDVPGMMNDTTRCSISMCALMFSGNDKESINKALEQLSKDDELGALSGGGYLRYIEEDGIHYGVMVLVFKNDRPLSIN